MGYQRRVHGESDCDSVPESRYSTLTDIIMGSDHLMLDLEEWSLVLNKMLKEMWALEYEVDELQHKFADSIGKMDLDNLDVDFIEDMMLKAKPLQTVLNDIR